MTGCGNQQATRTELSRGQTVVIGALDDGLWGVDVDIIRTPSGIQGCAVGSNTHNTHLKTLTTSAAQVSHTPSSLEDQLPPHLDMGAPGSLGSRLQAA